MSDLISRKEAIRALQELDMLKETRMTPEMNPGNFVIRLFLEAENMIEALPSAQPERKTGHWIDTDNYYQRWKCSECGCHTRDAKPNYCPHCGVEMRGE